jgi:Tfp pilus assembly protein PilF
MERALLINSALVAALLLCIAGTPAYAEEESLPIELAFIDDVIDDEAAAVEAVRKFDLAQQSLANWDIDTAQNLNDEGKPEEAEEKAASARNRITLIDHAYRHLLQVYPENAKALNFYGELLYDHFGDQVTAVKNWRLAAAYDDTLSAPHNNLGLHYCHNGDYRMGLRELDKALELEPDHPDYHFNLAQIYLVNGPQVKEIKGWSAKKTYRQAMAHSKRAAELSPDDYVLLQDYAVNFFAAENYGVKADWAAAAAAWASARAKARNETDEFFTWLNEARAWIENKDDERAEPCLKSALALKPDSAVVQQLIDKVGKEGD